jgi:hypothetical protein
MERCGGLKVYLYAFLTSVLEGGEWSASRPGSFSSGERAPSTHWTGGWMDLSHLDAVARPESNPGCPARNLVIVLTELSRFHVIIRNVYIYEAWGFNGNTFRCRVF